MSTNKTEHYGLHSWEAGDDFLREEFNENFEAIDKAIFSRCQVVFGSYTGSGATAQTIQLGKTPRAVLISRQGMSWSGNISYGGIIFPDCPSGSAQVVEGGFSVRASDGTGSNRGNVLNTVYQYMALYWEELQ